MSATHAPTIDVELERFVADEQPRLLRTLTSYVGDRDLAEELVAEALARMVRDWSTVGGMAAPGAYAHRTAINLANSWFRRKAAYRRAVARHGVPDEVHTDPDTAAQLAVREAVAALPDRQRATVSLHYLGGFELSEVATMLGVAEGTVRSNLHHARTTLRGVLGDRDVLASAVETQPRIETTEVLARGRTLDRRRRVGQAVAVMAMVAAVLAGGGLMAGLGQPDAPIVSDDAAPLPTGSFADGAVAVGTAVVPPTLTLGATGGLDGAALGTVTGPNPVVAIGADGTIGALRGTVLELRRGDELVASSDASAIMGPANLEPVTSVAVDGSGRVQLLTVVDGLVTVLALSQDGSTELLLDGQPLPQDIDDTAFHYLSVLADGSTVAAVVEVSFDPSFTEQRTGIRQLAVPGGTSWEESADSVLPMTDTRAVNGGQVVVSGGLAGLMYEGAVTFAVPGATVTGQLVGGDLGAVLDGPRNGAGSPVFGSGTGAMVATVETDSGFRGVLVAARADGRVALVDLGPGDASQRLEVIVGGDGAVYLSTPETAGARRVERMLDADLLPVADG